MARDRLARSLAEMRAVIHPRVRRLFATGDTPAPWISYQPARPLALAAPVARDQLAMWLDGIAGAVLALHWAGLVHGGVLEADVVTIDGELRLGGGGVWACADPGPLAFAARTLIAPERRRGAPATTASDGWALAQLVARWASGSAVPDPLGGLPRRHPRLAAALAPMLADDPAARGHDLIGFVAAVRESLTTPFVDDQQAPEPKSRRRKKQTTQEPTAVSPAPLHAVSMKPGGPNPRSLDKPTPPAPTPQIRRAVIRHASPAIAHQQTSEPVGRLAPPRAVVEAERRSRRRPIWLALIAILIMTVVVVVVVATR